ncbi:MAG: hypothetical protein IPJ39_13340 [Saprospiraceae bacterium]|nr:hypothetical protein [Saprospiraceae bacterium]
MWSSGATTAALNVAPTSTTTYTVTISDANGCSNSGLTTITVNPLPIAGITGTFTACAGSSITLTGTGGTQYLWSNGLTTTSINVIMPSTPSIMGVTVTDINGCTNTTEQALTPLVVPSISTIITQPTTCISTDGTISTTITNATSPTYIWSNGATTSGISGLSVGSYTVTVTSGNNGCTSVAVVGLIGPGGCNVCPTIGTLSISNPVCANTLTTLTASGLTDMGVTFGISFVSFPSATTDPYIGGTVLSTVSNGSLSSGGTVATASVSIPSGSYVIYAILSPSPTDPACRPSTSSALVVNPTPSAAIAITETSGLANNDGIICSGANATLTASGGGTYVWSTGATTGGITTGIAGTYTVTVTNLGCSASTSISITVNPLPIPMIAVVETSGLVNNDGIICSGTSAILTASGGITYAWSTGATTTGITTGTAGTYTVTVTNSNGCTASISSIITVNPLPIPAIAVVETSGLANNDGIICSGASATFTASGGGTYIWSTGATTSGITSGTAGIYTVTVTNSNGCTASASSTLTVNPLPIVTIARTDNSGTTPNDGIICAGATATLTANGGGTYLWSTGATTSGITSGTAGTYTVTVTNSNGCTASVSSTITVNPLPIAAIARTDNSSLTPNDGIICQGAMATLTASGGGTYVWSNGATTAGITTGTAGTYSVTVTSVNGCTASTSSSITVLPLPTPSISVSETSGTVANDGTIYTGSSANLTASGGCTYLWNTGATTSGITVTPSTTTTYTVTVTNANNCSAIAMTTITVIDPSCLLVCSGDQTITLTNGACEYQLPNLVTGAGDCAYFVVKQTAGPLPGELLKKGTYTITQQLISNLGEIIDECSYTVSVRANPIIVNSLTCNDHVNISVDINCEVTLSPDMFLEGNSYSCYADYQINIWPFNSQANALNNITQNTAMYLPCGNHTYEIVGPSGNRCWGTFTIEDKIAPVVSCNCVDMPVTTPITSFAGSLDLTDPSFARPNGTTVCANTGAGPDFYDVYPFTVSTTGLYTFNAAGSNGDTYAILYTAPFDPLNPCTNFIVANDDTAGGLDPLITVSLTAGVQYVYVFTTFGTKIATGTYKVTITGAGQVQTVTNPANAPECQFACYELPVVQGETVGMLYDIPGQNANKSKLSAPPAVRDACGPVSMTFEDRVTGTNCGATKLRRDWKFTDAKGNTTLCSQTFTFNQITVFDLVPPVREVHLTCGLDATPAAIAGYLDVDSRTQPASATNIGAYADDYAQTGSVVEFNEGYSYGYFTYQFLRICCTSRSA